MGGTEQVYRATRVVGGAEQVYRSTRVVGGTEQVYRATRVVGLNKYTELQGCMWWVGLNKYSYKGDGCFGLKS